MGDTIKFVETVKKIALSAIKTTKPMEIMYGIVKQINPLKVGLNQKLILEKDDLILTDNVADLVTEITAVEWLTENKSGGSGEAAFASHNHELKGKKKVIIHNSLKAGEKVILLRVQGGQQFIVLNRVR